MKVTTPVIVKVPGGWFDDAGELRCGEFTSGTFYPCTEDRPHWLRHVRVYERAATLGDPTALDVLKDAFELGNADSADEIIREYGVVGAWRPSTIIVDRLTDYGANRLIVEQTIAHALWNADLHIPVRRGYPFEIDLWNDELRPRYIRATFHMEPFTDRELLGVAATPADDHDARIAQLERQVNNLIQRQARDLDQQARALDPNRPHWPRGRKP